MGGAAAILLYLDADDDLIPNQVSRMLSEAVRGDGHPSRERESERQRTGTSREQTEHERQGASETRAARSFPKNVLGDGGPI